MRLKTVLAIALTTAALAGCKSMDYNSLAQSGGQMFEAATLSDAEVIKFANGACQEMDAENKLAPASGKYSQRMNKIAKALGSDINGIPLNYKVYMTPDVNAWAMANGCVRVYSGLMDMMTDNEIEGVLGHEIGHVSLGHSRKAMQVAYASVAAKNAAGAAGGVAAELSKGQLADMGVKLINAQFSQHQETEADNFSYDLLKKRNVNTEGLATSFEKLASLDKGKSSMFDSHPPSKERAENIRARIAVDKQ